MSKLRQRIPFNVGDKVKFWLPDEKKIGVVDCICEDWVRLKDKSELRMGYIWKIQIIKKADVAKEAEEFLKRECPKGQLPLPDGRSL